MSREHSEQPHADVPAGVGRRAVLLGALGIPAAAAVTACGGDGGGNQTGVYGGGPTATTPGGQGTSPPSSPAASGESKAVQPPITVRGQEADYHGEQSVIGKTSATVDLYDFYFEPTVLVGSPGQELTVNLLNEGKVAHTFTIEEQNIDVILKPGEKGQTKLKFPESGRQGVVCTYHIAQGMLGVLVTKS